MHADNFFSAVIRRNGGGGRAAEETATRETRNVGGLLNKLIRIFGNVTSGKCRGNVT
jgi:hypothetical protein